MGKFIVRVRRDIEIRRDKENWKLHISWSLRCEIRQDRAS